MASIVNDPGDRRRILFVDRNGDRKALWLGKVSKRTAAEIKNRVEAINAALNAGHAIDGDTATWLADIGDRLHAKLAKAGLVPPRLPATPTEQPQLGAFLDSYIAGRTDAKRRTRLNLGMFRDRLTAFFGAERDITSIKRSDADAWVIDLKAKYAMATAGRTIKGARQHRLRHPPLPRHGQELPNPADEDHSTRGSDALAEAVPEHAGIA